MHNVSALLTFFTFGRGIFLEITIRRRLLFTPLTSSPPTVTLRLSDE